MQGKTIEVSNHIPDGPAGDVYYYRPGRVYLSRKEIVARVTREVEKVLFFMDGPDRLVLTLCIEEDEEDEQPAQGSGEVPGEESR